MLWLLNFVDNFWKCFKRMVQPKTWLPKNITISQGFLWFQMLFLTIKYPWIRYAMTTFVRQFPKHVFIPLQRGDSNERQPLVQPSALCPTRCVYFSVNVPIVYQRCQMRWGYVCEYIKSKSIAGLDLGSQFRHEPWKGAPTHHCCFFGHEITTGSGRCNT